MKKGEYKFENLNPGRYKITANLPNDLWIPESREFYAGGKPFCQNYYLFAYANGSISGNVINADGTPGRLKLNISPSSSSTRFYYGETQTDENGNFTFHGLPEGNYRIYVSLNSYSLDGARSYPFEGFPYSTYYFPKTFEYKEAKIINLGHTEKIQNINLKMPLVPIKKTISGIVVWEDGRSSNKGVIYYRLKNTGTSRLGYIYAKEDGTFSFQVFDGVDYEIYAENNSQESYGVSEWIELNKNNLNKLVVKPRK